MFKSLQTIFAATALTMAVPASADIITLDFENLGTHSSQVTTFSHGTIGAVRGHWDGRRVPGQAVIFDSTLSNTRDRDLEGPFERASNWTSHNLGNLLIIQETPGGEADDNAFGGALTFVFNEPVRLESFDLIDIDVSRFSLSLIDGFGNFLGRRTFGNVNLNTNSFGENLFDTFEVGIDNIATAIFDFGRQSGALDNIRFSTYEAPEVPIPAAGWLFITAIAGGMLSRRR